MGKLASAAKCNNKNTNAKVTCIITSEKVKDTETERERERDVKLSSNWQVKSEHHHHHHQNHRPFVYLRPRSRLYAPPYLHRFPASSVISGIQLANTAYIGYKNQQTTKQALSLTFTLWPNATVPTWILAPELASFSLLSTSGVP